MVAFAIYGQQSAAVFISSAESALCAFTLLMMYGLSVLPLCYLYSLAFINYSTALISIMAINFLTGFIFVLAYFVMINVDITQDLGYQLVYLFRCFPPYNIGEGLIAMANNYFQIVVVGRGRSFFAFKVCGQNMIYMAAEAVGFFGFMLFLESSVFENLKNSIVRYRSNLVGLPPPRLNAEDDDVRDEVASVKDCDLHDDKHILVINNLIKTYPPSVLGGTVKHAVRGVNLLVSSGERFGLLGINGKNI
jgi:hypothetical protein